MGRVVQRKRVFSWQANPFLSVGAKFVDVGGGSVGYGVSGQVKNIIFARSVCILFFSHKEEDV